MPQEKALRFNIKLPPSHLLDPLPVPLHHRLVQHSLQKGAGLIEVIDLLL